MPETSALPNAVISSTNTFLDIRLQGTCQLQLVCCCFREDREDFDLKAAEGNTGKRGRPDGAPAGAGGAGGKRVFVNNLAEETTWQALKDYFKQAGPVAHADVLTVRTCFLFSSACHPHAALLLSLRMPGMLNIVVN